MHDAVHPHQALPQPDAALPFRTQTTKDHTQSSRANRGKRVGQRSTYRSQRYTTTEPNLCTHQLSHLTALVQAVQRPQYTQQTRCRATQRKRGARHRTRRSTWKFEPAFEDMQAVTNNLEVESHDTATNILDSGAHPTHLNDNTKRMKPLKTPLTSRSATDQKSLCTHSTQLTLRPPPEPRFKLPAPYNKKIRNDLLSVCKPSNLDLVIVSNRQDSCT